MNLLSWLGDAFSSGGSNASGSRGGSGKGVYIPDPLGRLYQGSWEPIDRLPDTFGRLPGSGSQVELLGQDSSQEGGAMLTGSVGMTGDNRPSDVAKVEKMLGQTGHLDLGATDGPTGYYGARAEQGVKGFQKENGLKVDGLLNPGGETILALGAATESGEASPGMPPDSIGYPQTGGKTPVGPDAGTGTRQSKPGETQVAQAAAFVEPAAASVLAILAGKSSPTLSPDHRHRKARNPATAVRLCRFRSCLRKRPWSSSGPTRPLSANSFTIGSGSATTKERGSGTST